MRDYGTVAPQFWIGATGKALRKAGPEAQIVALYLMTSPHANMIGFYYLPMMYLAHETGLGMKGACKALQRAIEAGFCEYDGASEVVWVREMASHQIGEQLNAKDKRCLGVQRAYDALPENPFLQAFFDRYADQFHLTRGRGNGCETGSPLEGASKPLGSQDQEQEQEQEQDKETAAAGRDGKRLNGKARKPVATTIPPSFAFSDDLRSYVQKNLPDAEPDGLFEKFCDQAASKGWTNVDWRRAFQTYVRNCAPDSGHFAAGQFPRKPQAGKVNWAEF